MKSLLIQLLLLIIPLLVPGLPYGALEDLYNPEYDYDEDNEVSEEVAVMKAPGFISETMNLVVNEGETIRLPCIVTRLQGFVLLWKKNANIITVGDQILGNSDSRYYLEAKENGNNLVIKLAKPGDEGEYVCQVSAFKPTQIHHSVKIRVRPSIQTSPVNSLTVKEGEEARLYCRVLAGHPTPQLKWRKKGGIMPTGEEEIMGEDIVFESVTRKHEGTYECVTEDEYGFEPVTSEVQLHVEYAPVIEQEQTYIKTAAGEEIHVTCVVHAYPEPQVVWEKDGQIIGEETNGFVINRSGARHNLILLDVRKEFFGEYSCQARNDLGVASKSTQVSGDHTLHSELSSENTPNYPKLDIRNFYMETLGEIVFAEEPLIREGENLKIENMEGLKIFSYLSHLRKDINPDIAINPSKLLRESTSFVKSDGDNIDDNLVRLDENPVDKVNPSIEVTDLKDEKDMTNSYRGSFSEQSDLDEIFNLEKEKKIETTTDDNLEDIGTHNYFNSHKSNTDSNQENLSEKEKVPQKNEASTHYHHTIKNVDTLEKIKNEESTEITYQQSLSEDNIYSSLNQNDKNADNIIESGDYQTSSNEMTNSYRGSFSQHSDLDEIADLEYGEKAHITTDKMPLDAHNGAFSSHRYLDIYEGSSTKLPGSALIVEEIEESSGEDQPLEESDNIPFHQETEKKTSRQLDEKKEVLLTKSGSDSLEVTHNEVIIDDKSLQEPVAGGMYLTTSIVTEHVGDTHLETKSPYEKPYIIKTGSDSLEETYNEVIIDDTSHQGHVTSDMYLTTSIVNEHVGKTNLETKSPHEKPYIITTVSKEDIFSKDNSYVKKKGKNQIGDSIEKNESEKMINKENTGYVSIDSDKTFETGTDDSMTMTEKENVRPYPIDNTKYEDKQQMVPLGIQLDKQTNKQTEKSLDEFISPLMIDLTQSETTMEDTSEGIVDDQISPIMSQHLQSEPTKYKQTETTNRGIEDITYTNKINAEITMGGKLKENYEHDYVKEYIHYDDIKTVDAVHEESNNIVVEDQDEHYTTQDIFYHEPEVHGQSGQTELYTRVTTEEAGTDEGSYKGDEKYLELEDENIEGIIKIEEKPMKTESEEDHEDKSEVFEHFDPELHNQLEQTEEDIEGVKMDEKAWEHESKDDDDGIYEIHEEAWETESEGDHEDNLEVFDHLDPELKLEQTEIETNVRTEETGTADGYIKYLESETEDENIESEYDQKEQSEVHERIEDNAKNDDKTQETETKDKFKAIEQLEGASKNDENARETESKDDIKSKSDVIELEIETEKDTIGHTELEVNSEQKTKSDDYIDYSYAEMAAQKKEPGTKHDDHQLSTKNIRKKKTRKAIPWLKKFKFVMVGNKVVMVLRKAL